MLTPRVYYYYYIQQISHRTNNNINMRCSQHAWYDGRQKKTSQKMENKTKKTSTANCGVLSHSRKTINAKRDSWALINCEMNDEISISMFVLSSSLAVGSCCCFFIDFLPYCVSAWTEKMMKCHIGNGSKTFQPKRKKQHKIETNEKKMWVKTNA